MSFVLLTLLVILGYFAYFWYRERQRHSLRVGNMHKKVVLITGCDSGFGHATAVRLDSLGVPVFAGCLTEEGAKKLKEKCSSKLTTISLDVTKAETIQAAYETVRSNIPPGCEFWGVVNNAGVISLEGPTEFHSREDYRRTFEVNFLGMTDVNRTFLPLVKKSFGRIVNMASISGVAFLPRLAPYCASKVAVVAYSDIMRMEQSIWGVKVSVVEPGGFRTNLMANGYKEAKERQWESLPAHVQQEYGKDQFDRGTETMVKWQNERAPSDLSPVVSAYENALFSQHPKAHYMTDNEALMLYMFHLLPRSWYEKIIIREMVTKPQYMPKARLK